MSEEYLDNKIPLNLVQYASMDFPTYFDSLLTRIKVQYQDDYDDFGKTALGVMMPHTFAFGLSQLSWLMDRRVSALYFDTSESLHELTRLANTKGYKVNPATSSGGELKNTCEATTAVSIFPKGFKYSGADSLIYEAIADQTIPIGTTEFYVDVREGESRELTFTSDGVINQSYGLTGSSEEEKIWIARNSIYVFVNGVEWTEEDFLVLEKTDQYEVGYTEDPPQIRFGDGIVGNVPENGTDIVIRYILTNGGKGNVNHDTIKTADSIFSVAGSPVELTITNESRTSGGEDPESIRSIKKQAPLYVAARGAAVTPKDYDSHVNNFADPTYGSVAKGYALVVRKAENDPITTGFIGNVQSQSNSINANTNSVNLAIIANNDDSTGIQKSVDDIEGYISDITDKLSDLDSASTSIDTQNKDILDKATVIKSVGDAIIALAEGIKVDNGGADPAIDVKANQIITYVNVQINSSATTIISDTSILTGSLVTVDSSHDGIESDNASINSGLSDIDAFAIDNMLIVDGLYASTYSSSSSITSDLNGLLIHLDSLFDADCKSNVVMVPILTTDTDGFYVAPSNGLMIALQTFLNGIKEVSQFITVTSGADWLIEAGINVDVKLLSTSIKTEKSSEINRIIDGILKGRDFGDSLYLQHIYNKLRSVTGVDYLNVTIVNPLINVDADGNLIIEDREIITKGVVVVNIL